MWVEEFYLSQLEGAVHILDHYQRETSGYGTAHLETKRQAAEIGQWGHFEAAKNIHNFGKGE